MKTMHSPKWPLIIAFAPEGIKPLSFSYGVVPGQLRMQWWIYFVTWHPQLELKFFYWGPTLVLDFLTPARRHPWSLRIISLQLELDGSRAGCFGLISQSGGNGTTCICFLSTKTKPILYYMCVSCGTNGETCMQK